MYDEEQSYYPKEYNYKLCHILSPESTQEDLFKLVIQSKMDSLFKGVNGCVILKGEQGSGVNHTLIGGSHNSSEGILGRVLRESFRKVENGDYEGEGKIEIAVTAIEITQKNSLETITVCNTNNIYI